jgi:Ser/Thr protein kinase RdoA (MazF antagonist)
VWSDHILFEADRVTGLIDFGSMRIDNVSCDIARLLGGMSSVNSDLWRAGMQAYAAIRPLARPEMNLAEAFHRSGILLGVLNWSAWVFLDHRTFEEPQTVLQRMDALMSRIQSDLGLPPTGRELLL